MTANMTPNFTRFLMERLNEAMALRGNVNILIAGKTGVGKSTLVNAVFQGQLATTGQGRPVTLHTREITKEHIPLTILDTRGLEVSDYVETISALENLIQERGKERDPDRHIHAAWMCIVEDSHRVEEAESQLTAMLARHVPTIAVITKAKADEGFSATVRELLPQVRNVVRVRAKETVLDDGYTIGAMGLEELVTLTMEVIPEARRDAFAAAQRVSLRHKVNRSHAIVASAAAAAGGVGMSPIPFSDALAIIPIQISMLASISAVWGLPLSSAFLGTLVSGALSGSAGTLVGRSAVGALLKLIPGAGSIMGGIINTTTASLLTTTFGESYIAALYLLMKDRPEVLPTSEQIRDAFVEQLKHQQPLLPTESCPEN